MKKKPLLIIILAIFHLLQPLINILYLKLTTDYELSVIFSNLLELDGVKNNFDFWLLFPIGGIALLYLRSWTFFLFLAVQVYSIILHVTYEKFTWPYVSEYPLFFSIILLIFNFIFIIYAFLPEIRQLFFDKTKRWWETSKRFFISTPCKLTVISKGSSFNSNIINISKTGAFVECHIDLPKGTIISIDFNYKLKNYSFSGKLVSSHEINNIKGMGIKFLLDKFHANERPQIKELIKTIIKENPRIPTR